MVSLALWTPFVRCYLRKPGGLWTGGLCCPSLMPALGSGAFSEQPPRSPAHPQSEGIWVGGPLRVASHTPPPAGDIHPAQKARGRRQTHSHGPPGFVCGAADPEAIWGAVVPAGRGPGLPLKVEEAAAAGRPHIWPGITFLSHSPQGVPCMPQPGTARGKGDVCLPSPALRIATLWMHPSESLWGQHGLRTGLWAQDSNPGTATTTTT